MKIAVLLLLLVFANVCASQTVCDNYLSYTSWMLQNFTANAYNPMRVQHIYGYLRVLTGYIQATYQSCFNKTIIDPDSLYPRDITECMSMMYQTSLLSGIYTGNFAKIKSNLDSIARVIFSASNNCRPVMYYTGWTNLTDDCLNNIQSLDDLFDRYDSEIILGRNGFEYVNNMILAAQKTRKTCGFDILVKSKAWASDTCTAANNNWLYPLTDSLDNFIHQKNNKSFIEGFYNFYQTIYRVKAVCRISENENMLSSE